MEQPAVVCQECTVADDGAEDCTFSVVVRQRLGDRDCTAQYNCCLSATTDCRRFCCYPPFASIAKGEVFVLLYVCLFVCSSTISRQPAGRFTPYFACGRSLGYDVSSPLLGVGGPRRAEKEANEIFVTMGVNGEFLHFERFSNTCTDPHQILFM